MFKPFFIHRHHLPGKLPNRHPRGFTAYIEEAQNSNHVLMRVALCSPKDQYSRKEGRSFARVAVQETINKRHLPRILAGLEYMCELSDTINENNWYYIYKYVL